MELGELGEPLTLLESIAKVPASLQNVHLLTSFASLSHASTITVYAITTIQTRKKTGINHWVLHSLLIVVIALEPFFSDSQVLQCHQYLVLYAILLEHYL